MPGGQREAGGRPRRRGRVERSERPAAPVRQLPLDQRVETFRRAAADLPAHPVRELRGAITKLLRRIDTQDETWRAAAAPLLLAPERPRDPAAAARHRELLQAVRKLAVLRSRVLALAFAAARRRAGGRAPAPRGR